MENLLISRKIAHSLDEIITSVEAQTGQLFDDTEASEIYAHTVRKCKMNGKGADYIPILFENELRDSITREYINTKSEEKLRMKSSITGGVLHV